MIRYILSLAFCIVSSTAHCSQIKCGNPDIIAIMSDETTYVTQNKIVLNSIKNQIIKLYSIEPPAFDTALITFDGLSLTVGIGNKDIVCQIIKAEGPESLDIAKYIVATKI